MKTHEVFDKYLDRVGRTPAARLAWVLGLLNRYRNHHGADWLPGDWSNLSRELAFVAGIGNALEGWGGPVFSEGEITEWPSLKETQTILANCQQLVDDAEQHRAIRVPTFPVKRTLQWVSKLGRYLLQEDYDDRATWADRVQYALAFLVKEEVHRIQRCPARLPHEGKRCANYFLKSKRQKYCSKTCTSREMTRAKRERDSSPTSHARATKGGSHGTKARR